METLTIIMNTATMWLPLWLPALLLLAIFAPSDEFK